jgi:hypothetical protein
LPHSIWLGQVKPPEHAWLDSNIPRLLLGSSKKNPIERIKELESELELKIKPRMDILREIPKQEFGASSYETKEEMREQKKRVRKFLLEKKYIVDLTNCKHEYTVYVINLSDEVGPRIRRHRWVYVGQSLRPPEERLEQHFNGYKSSKWVKKYGQRLNYTLFKDIPTVRFRQDAEMLERLLAKDLERRGFNVKGGH